MRKIWRARLMRDSSGFSLVEVIVILGIMGVLMTMAALQVSQSQPMMKSDGAMRVVLAQLNSARELAITQRRYMRIAFTVNGNQLTISREEVPAALTLMATIYLEGNVRFTVVTGVIDTPDAFGQASGVDFGSATQIRFATDGTLIDQNGNSLNGTIFLSVPGVTRSARAVTVLGSTGRVRGYRFDGATWQRV
jgi:type II secretory pathway pseudopilin PulG